MFQVFQVGDLVLVQTMELPDAADIGKPRQGWDGPFKLSTASSPSSRGPAPHGLRHLGRCPTLGRGDMQRV